MRAACLIAWLVLLVPVSGRAEIYRCPGADGSVRFSSDPGACPRAEPYQPRQRLERVPSARSPAASPAAGFLRPDELLAVFPPAGALGAGWEIVEEVPTDPADDPTLRAARVRAARARHYTRYRGRQSQVCSLEVWSFGDAADAAAAARSFQPPGWRVEDAGSLLLSVRGVTLERGGSPSKGLFAECHRLLEITRGRLASPRP